MLVPSFLFAEVVCVNNFHHYSFAQSTNNVRYGTVNICNIFYFLDHCFEYFNI